MTDHENSTLADAIARDHGRSLRRFVASRLRRARDAVDDVVQEVYLRIIRRGRDETIRNPEAYVIQVAAHTLHDLGYGSRQAGESANLSFIEREDVGDADPMVQADQQRRLEKIDHILRELPPRVYASFVLYRVHELDHKKIARLHGVHANTVKNDIKSAVSHLTQRLGREDA